MRRLLYLAIAITAISLTACAPHEEMPAPSASPGATETTPEDDGAETKPVEDACGASKLGAYLNLLPTSDAKEKIAATVGPRPIRYINPGDAVTADFRSERLNVEIGTDGRIKSFRCF